MSQTGCYYCGALGPLTHATDCKGVLPEYWTKVNIRDHFAGLAMQALMKATPGSEGWYATQAYAMADAMLEARRG